MDEELYSALMYNPRLAAQGERRRQRNEETGDPSGMAELAAGFHPVLGPALSAKDLKESYENDDKLGMGLAALGMLPVVGGTVKPIAKALFKPTYDVFKEIPNVKSFFKTERKKDTPSLYAHMDDFTTQGYREPSNRAGEGYKMQDKSGKTVFVNDTEELIRAFKNKDIHTEIQATPNKTLQVVAKEPGSSMFFGKFKKDQVLAEVPFETAPKVGMYPLELNSSKVNGVNPNVSPIGSDGRGIHFGSEISEVVPSVQNKAAGGEVKISEDTLFDPKGSDYDYKTARAYGMGSGDDGHWGSVAPASRQERELYNLPEDSYVMLKGAQHPTWQKAVDAEQDRGSKIVKHGDRYYSVPQEIKKAKGGAIKMPDNYSNGSWKLI
tara:strand:+ start:1750 stop:2889 length:1140 start_codon:yes stop_codon:yes gene_type:complete